VGPTPARVAVSDTLWTVAHNLGHHPAGITVVLLSGEVVWPDRDDLDENTSVLTFKTPSAGLATVV
jgi:hypothetical protein